MPPPAGKTTATLSRQLLVLDNARYIGDSAWRQHLQTFDAFVLQDKTLQNTTFTYAYLEQINRVFGHEHAQGTWQSNSHLFNANYTGFAASTVTSYVYLLDFKKRRHQFLRDLRPELRRHARTFHSVKIRVPRRPRHPIRLRLKSPQLFRHLHSARNRSQSESGIHHTWLRATRRRSQRRLQNSPGNTARVRWLGRSLLDHATGRFAGHLHQSHGEPPGKIAFAAYWHQFDTDLADVRLGHEFDALVSRKFGKYLTGLVKYANFRHESPAYPNVQKFWTQIEFAY